MKTNELTILTNWLFWRNKPYIYLWATDYIKNISCLVSSMCTHSEKYISNMKKSYQIVLVNMHNIKIFFKRKNQLYV